jgi:hypothetical protein
MEQDFASWAGRGTTSKKRGLRRSGKKNPLTSEATL